mgnify:CR=1 FL=1
MKSFEYTIKDELGIHARPAGMLVKEAKKFASECTITKDGKTKKLTQLMMLMSLGVKQGDTVTVVMNEHVDYDGKQYPIASLPENLMSIIQAGGLVKAMRKLNGLD